MSYYQVQGGGAYEGLSAVFHWVDVMVDEANDHGFGVYSGVVIPGPLPTIPSCLRTRPIQGPHGRPTPSLALTMLTRWRWRDRPAWGTKMPWIRSLMKTLGGSVCRLLTLLGNGADDCWDCRADDAIEKVVVEKRQGKRVPAD